MEAGEGDVLLILGSSPRVVRKPPREKSSESVGGSLARTPISSLADPGGLEICSFQSSESMGAWWKVVRTRVWEMVS